MARPEGTASPDVDRANPAAGGSAGALRAGRSFARTLAALREAPAEAELRIDLLKALSPGLDACERRLLTMMAALIAAITRAEVPRISHGFSATQSRNRSMTVLVCLIARTM